MPLRDLIYSQAYYCRTLCSHPRNGGSQRTRSAVPEGTHLFSKQRRKPFRFTIHEWSLASDSN